MEKQPAKLNYFFDQGFKELKATINDSWVNNNNSAQENFEKASNYYWRSWGAFNKIFRYATGVTMYLFGSFWFLALSLLHITILFVVYCIVYFLFTFTWVLDYLYRVKENIFTPCPHPGCHEKVGLPIYYCPQCNAKHTQLWPSKYGIWTRTCICGAKIPCTFFNGRGKLRAECPKCENKISTEEGTPLIIPIVGPPYAGKSTYLYSMIDKLKEEFTQKGYDIHSNINQRLIDNSIQELSSGSVRKNVEIDTTAVDLIISKGNTKYAIYFYDVAGEAFNMSGSMETHTYYRDFSAMFFFLDPFAIEEVRNEYYEQFKNYLNKTSQANANIYDNALGINEVFANLKRHLAQNPYNIKDEMRVKQCLAVLIPKTDFFSDNIFETDKECRSFLSKFGQKQFVDDISWKFKNVHFFNVISKGKDSIGVLHPFEWILKKEITKKQIRRFFGNLLMAFFITVVVGGVAVGGFYAYRAGANYFANGMFTSSNEDGNEDVAYVSNQYLQDKGNVLTGNGMNVELELSVLNVIRSLSNNNQDENFNKALDMAYSSQFTNNRNFIDLFFEEYKKLDPGARLSAIFSTFELKDKITPQTSDTQVISILKGELENAIDNAVNILSRRINLFGVISPDIQRMETVGHILVKLPDVKDPQRVRRILQSSANLEFWETYHLPDIYQQLVAVDNLLVTMKNAESAVDGTADDLLSQLQQDQDDPEAALSMEKFSKQHPLFALLQLNQYNGQLTNGSAIGVANTNDRAKIDEYLNMRQVKDILPRNLSLKWGVKAIDEKEQYYELYALKLTNRDGKAVLDGDVITDAISTKEGTQQIITLSMNAEGTKNLAHLTKENIGRDIAIVLDDYVYATPRVSDEVTKGQIQISVDFTPEEAKDLSYVLKSGKMATFLLILQENLASSSQVKQMTGWSTFLLQGNVEKVIYNDGRYLYFNTDGNVRKQNFRGYVRGRVVGGATKKDYEYVYTSSTHFIIKQFTSYPDNKPIPLKIVYEDNVRRDITDDTEGMGWIFTYDTNNRMTKINEPEYGFGCITTYAYEANNTYPSKKEVEYYYSDGGGTKENFIFSGYVLDDHGNWIKRSVKYQIVEETQDNKTETKTNEYDEKRSISYF